MKVFFEFQFGYRDGHSTILALTDIIDTIKQNIDNNEFTVGIFLDLTKAFDTVDHCILLEKLKHYGIRGNAHSLLKSYLRNRSMYTTINDVKSDLCQIDFGVPQGSVLGPLLFTSYINDIMHCIPKKHSRLFADDTGIFTHGRDFIMLKDQSISKYRILFNWCLDNRLTINLSKTCFIIFRTKNKRIPADFVDLKMDDISISRVNVIKYLGVYIDEHLYWDQHISYLCKTLTKYFGILKKYVNPSLLK